MLYKEEEDLLRAREFAIQKHWGQKYGEKPYIYHIDKVVIILKDLGYSISYQIVGCLHDVVEDTETTVKEISYPFGDVIGKSVEAITDEPGENRKERKEKTYPKIKKDKIALCVKIADRIANVNECVFNENRDLLKMYIKEQTFFYNELYTTDTREKPLWDAYFYLLEKHHLQIMQILVS